MSLLSIQACYLILVYIYILLAFYYKFSSVFTTEDISSLPVPDAKFQEAKSDYLGQLVVTPEMVAKKIKAMKDNKSPGVDGIKKNQYTTTEWKEANIIPLFKKGLRNK